MSIEYNQYLEKHKRNVANAFRWIRDNLPELLVDDYNYEYNCCFAHDTSKLNEDEYRPYDAYFYGGNRSFQVVQDYNRSWLLHIHRNPHHWQHWVLINDDPNEGEIALDMPYEYIIEMICDWWSFSWNIGNLYEIFDWYDERRLYIKMSDKTQLYVDHIINEIWMKLKELDSPELIHHGVKGQQWGVKNGPPYPINHTRVTSKPVAKNPETSKIIDGAVRAGQIKLGINREKQMRHTKSAHLPGRSYLDGDLDFAQQLIDKYSGTGEAIVVNGEWTHRERIQTSDELGTYVNRNGDELKSENAMIIYSKTGTHVYPIKKGE